MIYYLGLDRRSGVGRFGVRNVKVSRSHIEIRYVIHEKSGTSSRSPREVVNYILEQL